nr:PREDICTED: cornifelin homolog [Latimeria chalumnae]|eukprot:XP_014349801.1 PREDICTED: cornifelin homolog [Latimeria chalumnae]
MAVQPVVMVQPSATLALVHQKSNSWSSGMCNCCEDMGICCCACWCGPCFLCKTTSDFGACLCLPLLDPWCFSCACSPGLIPPVTLAMRSSVCERYAIEVSSVFRLKHVLDLSTERVRCGQRRRRLPPMLACQCASILPWRDHLKGKE